MDTFAYVLFVFDRDIFLSLLRGQCISEIKSNCCYLYNYADLGTYNTPGLVYSIISCGY